MIWAHSINPIAMIAAIAVTVYAVLSISAFAVWVLYTLWLERIGEQPDYALRLLRRLVARPVGAAGASGPVPATAVGYRSGVSRAHGKETD
ncbi:MAG TPA: hypothetical protein VKA76_06225 [Gammaproteobacteria bacterium]|nr:hypothetical protein [Gammaproteobacteria bacterium]